MALLVLILLIAFVNCEERPIMKNYCKASARQVADAEKCLMEVFVRSLIANL